jgi:hypothetical protein
MTASLRALLTNVIDYAGLFPPASLSLDQSIRNYARYLAQDDRWMLGRFICPAARLQELRPYIGELFTETMPLPISDLGRGGKDSAEIAGGFATDLEAIAAFRDFAGPRALIDVIETKILPQPTIAETLLPEIAESAAATNLKVFCEVPLIPDSRDDLPAIARALAASPRLGFKLRTGGIEASAFPTTQQIAVTIVACRDAKCPMKFTAGLHHPIRLFHESVGTKMHGFINVFAAGVLAHAHGMDDHGVALILESESPSDFTFDEYGLSWKTLRASNQRIEQVRKSGLISFGSCSFDEPRDDLRSLGWM